MSGAGGSLGREAAYGTFFRQLRTMLASPAGSFKYIGRREASLGRLQPEQYPAFFFVEQGEQYDRGTLHAPAKVTLQAHGIIHALSSMIPGDEVAATLNNQADEVEAAVQAACGPTAQNTLDGLVQQAWVNGRQVTTPAAHSNRWSVQVLGIEMVLPHSR